VIVRWKIPTPFSWPSPEEIEKRFEERIRSRWRGSEESIPADVFLAGEEIVVLVDLPGVPMHDVHVHLFGATLEIEATRRERTPSGEAQPARLERPRGPLRRVVALPRPVQRIFEVELEEGVLVVRLRVESTG
jgi:HSP20 family molecular chaperone IbpA